MTKIADDLFASRAVENSLIGGEVELKNWLTAEADYMMISIRRRDVYGTRTPINYWIVPIQPGFSDYSVATRQILITEKVLTVKFERILIQKLTEAAKKITSEIEDKTVRDLKVNRILTLMKSMNYLEPCEIIISVKTPLINDTQYQRKTIFYDDETLRLLIKREKYFFRGKSKKILNSIKNNQKTNTGIALEYLASLNSRVFFLTQFLPFPSI